jgi:hypothetical protein
VTDRRDDRNLQVCCTNHLFLVERPEIFRRTTPAGDRDIDRIVISFRLRRLTDGSRRRSPSRLPHPAPEPGQSRRDPGLRRSGTRRMSLTAAPVWKICDDTDPSGQKPEVFAYRH